MNFRIALKSIGKPVRSCSKKCRVDLFLAWPLLLVGILKGWPRNWWCMLVTFKNTVPRYGFFLALPKTGDVWSMELILQSLDILQNTVSSLTSKYTACTRLFFETFDIQTNSSHPLWDGLNCRSIQFIFCRRNAPNSIKLVVCNRFPRLVDTQPPWKWSLPGALAFWACMFARDAGMARKCRRLFFFE